MSASLRPFSVASGESRSPNIFGMGGQLSLKVSGADTPGAFVVFEVPTLPDAGPPLHLHQVENEWFYVLAGEHDFKIGDNCSAYHLAAVHWRPG
jgi:quercetin dioxygenase-like cupin family protein